MGQAPHGPVWRVSPAQQGQHLQQSLFGMGHLRTVTGRTGGPGSAPRCAEGQRGENSPPSAHPGNPLMLFANTGGFTPLPARLWPGIGGEHVARAARSCVTPGLPCGTPGTKPPAPPPGPALRGDRGPPGPGRCSRTRAGDRARPRGPAHPVRPGLARWKPLKEQRKALLAVPSSSSRPRGCPEQSGSVLG